MDTMLRALMPFIKLFQAVGLSPLIVTDSKIIEARHMTIYSIVSIATFLIAFLYGFFQEDLFSIPNEQPMNEIAHTVDFIQLTGIRIAHLIILFEALVQRKNLIRLISRLNDWDLIVQKQFNTLHFDHQVIRKKILFKLLGSGTFYLGIQLTLLLIILLRAQYQFTYYWSLYLIPFTDRFQLVNMKIEQLQLNASIENSFKNSSRNAKSNSNSPNNHTNDLSSIDQLIIVRQLYDKLWELTNLTNKCFGLSLLVNIGNDFVAITGHCYWIFLTIENIPVGTNDILAVIGSCIWTIPSLINSFMIASICHVTVEKAHEAGFVLHQIKHDPLNEGQNMVIQQFSLQLLHQKIKFTAYGFFNIDFSLLFTMISASTTYLVIIIQMHKDA
uniref:Gustatory receptor n=1 Tax=Culicoides sonorensis TaxID=179676 RepID=A0A336KB81_CULSO